MSIHPDFEDLLRLLEEYGVEYMLINEIDGVTYEEARPNVVRGAYGGVEVTFIGFDDLIRNKNATPRAKDKGDVEELTQQEDAADG